MATRKTTLWVPERREINFIQYNPAVGEEMPDDQPMLVISTKAFNDRTGLVVGFPKTHAERHADNPFAIPAPGAKSDPGYLLTHQPKSFDWRERNARPHPRGAGHSKLMAAALKRFDSVFEICNHHWLGLPSQPPPVHARLWTPAHRVAAGQAAHGLRRS